MFSTEITRLPQAPEAKGSILRVLDSSRCKGLESVHVRLRLSLVDALGFRAAGHIITGSRAIKNHAHGKWTEEFKGHIEVYWSSPSDHFHLRPWMKHVHVLSLVSCTSTSWQKKIKTLLGR